jgi:uncharacterized protein YkwD
VNKRGALTITLIATAALSLPSAAQAGCPGANLLPSELTPKTAAAATVCAINQVRRNHGVRKLKQNKRLMKAARRHSQAMDKGNFFSHYSLTGADMVDRIARTGYLSGNGAWGVGENLRWGAGEQGTPRTAVAAWMASSSHRRTLLYGRYRHIGVGVALGSPIGSYESNSAIYTADFGYR